jgi:rhamnosyltransferase
VRVIDSGSTDGTVDIIKGYSSVRLIEISAREFGHSKTRNFAIANTKRDYIAMLTQDALPANRFWLADPAYSSNLALKHEDFSHASPTRVCL